MGLCPSRNATAKGKTYQPQTPVAPTPSHASQLRADASVFVPRIPAEQEGWELFLEAKRAELDGGKKGTKFARRQDGTYTSEYRKLLEATPKPRGAPTPRGTAAPATGHISDVLGSWKDCAPRPKPKTRTAEPKTTPQRAPDPLRDALRKIRAPAKEEVLAELAAVATKAGPADDSAAALPEQRCVPFGLTDRHYWSGDEDGKQSHVHCSRKPTPQRSYVCRLVTPELEEAMAEVLHSLRLLRVAEVGPTRRYCVGLREVLRATKEPGVLKAVLVAPDMEEAGGPKLDEKLQLLLSACKRSRTPVVFGLSRLRLGQAIKKATVSVSVLGILDTRGAQAPFARMLELA